MCEGLILLSSTLREQCGVRHYKEECNYLASDSCVFLRQLFILSVHWLLFWTLVRNSFCESTSSFTGLGGLGEWWNRCRVPVCTAQL